MLVLHRSERADQLVDSLGDLLAEPPSDPLAQEVVAVPTRGVERWLTQRLSHRLGARTGRGDGVCANIEFPFPGVLVGRATARACGFDPDADPWPPDRSVWRLIEIVDAHVGEPWLGELSSHLVESGTGGAAPRRFATLRHLADLYDRYSVHRPEMVQAWAEGAPHGWQAELWRRLRADIGVPSPAERFLSASDRLATEPELLELPDRLSLFGLTRLPASHLRVLEAVAAHRDVHLFLLHPSGALWDRIAHEHPSVSVATRRQDDPTRNAARHPLLRSWGRDAREMQLVLAARGTEVGQHRAVPDGATTLLGRIQADVRADRMPTEPVMLDRADDSLRIHSCHGKARQVEVLRDAVLHLLAADESLEPRDVIVMCPDIEVFAPLVHAAFGSGEADAGIDGGTPALRVRLADRSLRQTNPLLAVVSALLELAAGRVRASEVLDLVARQPVARRFGLDDEDLTELERWVAGTGIRWGLDGAHRSPWSLDGVDANTWRSGLDRLMLGVAMAEDGLRLFGDVLPLDDVSSSGVELAGRFCELVERLQAALDELQGPMRMAEWTEALIGATERLAEVGADEEWQREQLRVVLGEARVEAADSKAIIDRAEVSALLADRLKGRPTRANFRTGDLTICTLVPMRSVPHRVVCLLGLDDGVFPRHPVNDGDDLLLTDPIVGDRDARSEDRQLLLDALLAATERLVITYEGRDQRTNQERPPAVPVAELLDVVDRTAVHWDPDLRPRDAVVLRHPLQPFDDGNFVAGRLVPEMPWSFDPINLDGARALKRHDRSPRRPFLTDPLPALDRPVIQLDALVRFVEHPTRAFLRERLGLYLSEGPGRPLDALPVELDPLERWGVGQRLLDARLEGVDSDLALTAERGRGLLPPGPLADGVLTEVGPTVEALVERVASLPCAAVEAESHEVNLRLPSGRSLVGTVPGVRDDTILRCVFSRLGPKHRLAAWVRFLALVAALPDRAISAFTLGRGHAPMKRGASISTSTFELSGSAVQRQTAALAALSDLAALYDLGMREPLPIYCDTSAAWAEARHAGEPDALERARRVWQSDPDSPVPGEDGQAEHVLVLGGVAHFDSVRTDRFDLLAVGLWTPLLERERRSDR